MPFTITSDRPAVIDLVAELREKQPDRSTQDLVRDALAEYYGFAPGDNIYGGTEAALCLGYRNHGEDENLTEAIVQDLASVIEESKASSQLA